MGSRRRERLGLERGHVDLSRRRRRQALVQFPVVNLHDGLAKLASEPRGKALGHKHRSVLARGTPESHVDALVAAASKLGDERHRLVLEHVKESVKAALRTDELLHSIMLWIEGWNLCHERPRIGQEAHIEHKVCFWLASLEGER